MIKNKVSFGVVAIFAAGTTASAFALEPMPIEMGAFNVTPTLKLSESYDDNIREVGVNEESSWVTSISPNVLIEAINNLDVFQLGYRLNHDIFHDSRDDDNTDHHLRSMAHFDLNSRNRLTLNARYDYTETVIDTTVVGENDKFNTLNMDAVYGLGVPTAMFSMDVAVSHERKRTHNSGNLNADREFDRMGYAATLYYSVGPRTRVLVEYRYDDFDYELSSSTLDNTRQRMFVGASWAATAKTSGAIRVGYEERDFDDNAIRDPSNFSWEVGVTWQPLTYSTFSLSSSQAIDEGRVFSNFVETTRASVNWNHHWSEQFSSDISYSWIDEDYQSSIDREDTTHEVGLDLRYDVQRWLSVGLGYRYKDRDSNVAARDFDRNVYTLTFNISL